MASDALTPEQLATLVDIAERRIARLKRGATPGVVVRHTGMSPEERLVYGAQNDLKSAHIEYTLAARALASAQDNYKRAEELLARATERLAELERGENAPSGATSQ